MFSFQNTDRSSKIFMIAKRMVEEIYFKILYLCMNEQEGTTDCRICFELDFKDIVFFVGK